MNGIDISNIQGNVNMNQVKASGIDFVVAKASEDTTFIDAYYNQNIANAKSVGLLTGAYHLATFIDVTSATNEANFFVANCCNAKPDFVVLDFEQQCSGDMTEACLAFLDIISKVASAVIYCNPTYINAYLNSAITKYPLWVADYGVSSPETPLWENYDMWQYSDTGNVNGVSCTVDLDIMTDDFYNLLIGGKKQVENIVVFNYGPDQGAAQYLANYLQCPTISNSIEFDFTQVKNIYPVGGKQEEYTSYAKPVISGADEYETMKAVLQFCGKI